MTNINAVNVVPSLVAKTNVTASGMDEVTLNAKLIFPATEGRVLADLMGTINKRYAGGLTLMLRDYIREIHPKLWMMADALSKKSALKKPLSTRAGGVS